ncbi:coiled-coil domain-containing protein 87-like [Anneissia japonica]|uniref:coiled-coil domain-containing protein 87-like n=1 Tax=Anneissia japonica TaxID=1529436 RepID=UPI001425B135|nr:coiled-coil domain-containing protein 87-like [Anneissia japonica]
MASMKVPRKADKGTEKPVPKKNGMYSLGKLPFATAEIKNKYEDVLGPLTIFAPFFHENVPKKQELNLERPVTPIDESIKAPPATYQDLVKLIRRRIAADPQTTHLSVNDQQTLAGIIIGEVNSIWPDIRRQVDDSFLTPDENKELQRRITVHIVTVCQQLFQHYVQKATILNERGIFSGPANMSRLKAQLSLDATKFLNILIIRRHIVADMRGQVSDSEYDSSEEPIEDAGAGPLSYQKMIESSRPKRKKHYKQTVNREVRDLNRKMATIDMYKVLDYLPDIEAFSPSEARMDQPSSIDAGTKKETADGTQPLKGVSSESLQYKLQRSNSLPQLDHETLGQELGITKSSLQRSSSTVHLYNQQQKHEGVSDKMEKIDDKPDTRQYMKRDLDRLSTYHSARVAAQDEQLPEEEDLPPLLQAVGDTSRSDRRRELMQEHLKEMQEKRLIQEADDIVYISEPTHPQPATKTTRLKNKTVIRTSDVRVSERVNMSSITLQLNRTVFNELNNEVTPATIKKMDSNLFRGKEIREVYNEIMKTLPTDHFEYDVDDFVEPPGPYIDLHNLVNTASLMKSRKERVLNPELRTDELPPWGVDYEEWCKSPIFNASFAKPRPQRTTASQLTKLTGALNSSLNLTQSGMDPSYGLVAPPSNGFSFESSLQQKAQGQRGLIDDRNERSYQSWLAWWKNTISSEDYVKFLTTQESDFMGAIFHMYDSGPEDEDDNDEEKSINSAKATRLKEREEKLNELKSKKTEFTSGMWNVNSVMLGGLGNDPEIEVEENDEESYYTAENIPTVRRSHLRTRLGSRSQSQISMKSSASGYGLLNVGPIESRPASRSQSRLSIQDGSMKSGLVKSPGQNSPSCTAGTTVSSPQHRLEKIWAALQVPDNLRLDMAIKYSSDGHVEKLDSCIEHWESAMVLVLEREAILGRLEAFERLASDPNRFFQKGYRGLATARLEEARQRSHIYLQLEELDKKVKKKVQFVCKEFGDVITFQGRPYLEKMKLDRTEMLYWLQQERRQHALERHAMVQEYKLKMAELPPLGAIPATQ